MFDDSEAMFDDKGSYVRIYAFYGPSNLQVWLWQQQRQDIFLPSSKWKGFLESVVITNLILFLAPQTIPPS